MRAEHALDTASLKLLRAQRRNDDEFERVGQWRSVNHRTEPLPETGTSVLREAVADLALASRGRQQARKVGTSTIAQKATRLPGIMRVRQSAMSCAQVTRRFRYGCAAKPDPTQSLTVL